MFVLKVGVNDWWQQLVVDAVHVNRTIVVLEFMERPCSGVVAWSVVGHRRVENQWQRLRVLQVWHQWGWIRCDLGDRLRRLHWQSRETERSWRAVHKWNWTLATGCASLAERQRWRWRHDTARWYWNSCVQLDMLLLDSWRDRWCVKAGSWRDTIVSWRWDLAFHGRWWRSWWRRSHNLWLWLLLGFRHKAVLWLRYKALWCALIWFGLLLLISRLFLLMNLLNRSLGNWCWSLREAQRGRLLRQRNFIKVRSCRWREFRNLFARDWWCCWRPNRNLGRCVNS